MPPKSSQNFRQQVDVRSPSQTHGQLNPFGKMWQNTIDTFKNGISRVFPGGPEIGEYGIEPYSVLQTPYAADAVPEPNPQGRPESTTSSIGAAGTAIYSGFVTDLGEYKASLMGNNAFPTWEQMRRSDPDVYAGLLACKLPVRAAQYQIIPGATAADPNHKFALEIAKFVEDNLFGGLETMTSTGFFQTQSFEKVIENALLMLDFGCACDEILWHVDGDKVRVRRLAPRLPITYFRYWPDSDGETLLALEQYGYRGDEYVNVVLPAEKINYYVHEQEGADYFGFALALDTPIPTPNGWRQMGELQEGDYIFDEQGLPTRITGVSEIWKNRPCYKVTFDDGDYVIADENHLWQVQSQYERAFRKPGKTRKTKDIAATVKGLKGKVSNYSIETTKPVEYPEKDLPLDPYVLGLWLGDGDKNGGRIAIDAQDAQESCAFLDELGYDWSINTNGKTNSLGLVIHVKGIKAILKSLGVLKNKFIPDSYLQGSVSQRQSLLQGLMDSDGTVEQYGLCSFSNTNLQLIGGVADLVRSLGEIPSVRLTQNEKYGFARCWNVKFYPTNSPFRLSRKTNKLLEINSKKKFRRNRHYIKSVQRIENRDTVCIEVESKSHLFLAGYGMYPTHNSILRRAYMPWYFKTRLYAIDGIALERNAMGVPWIKMASGYAKEDRQYATKFVTAYSAHENTGLVTPDTWNFEIVGTKGRLRDPKTSIQHFSEQILRSMLAGFLAFGTTQSGSRSLGADMIGFFKMSLNALARNIAATMTNNVIRRLVDYNYGDSRQQIPYPSLSFSNIVAIDPLDLADKIKSLAQWQVDIVQPDDEIENWFRREFGMPLKTATRPRVMPLNQREMIKEDLTPEQAEQQSITEARAGIDKQNNPNLNPTAAQNTQTTAQSAKPKAKTPVEAVHPSNGKKVEEPGNQKYDPGVEPNPHRTTIEDEQGEKGKGKVSASEHFFGTDQIETIISALEMLGDKSSDRRAITCDFDGVINIEQNHDQHVHKPNEFGQVSQNAVALLTRLHDAGFKIIVTTARKNLLPVYEFLTTNHVPFDDLGNTKMPTLAYIDDRGLHIDWGENYDPAKVQEVFQKLATIAQQHGEPVEGFV